MTDTRCEPPEELRGVDGWHWVRFGDKLPEPQEWSKRGHWHAHHMGLPDWRYLAPVATPAEVEALRRERDEARAEANEWCQKVQLFEDVAQRRKNERDALGIAFTKLSAVLRVNMLRHGPKASHAEISAAIDACLGPVARAALSAALAVAEGEGVYLCKVPAEQDISGGGHGNGYILRGKIGWNNAIRATLAGKVKV